MMTPMGQLVDSIQGAVNDNTDKAGGRIRALLQEFYYDFCRLHNWQPLRRVKTMIFTGSSTGELLPANLVNIVVTGDSDGLVYHLQEAGDNQLLDGRCHAYYAQDAVAALEDRKALTMEQDATAFTVTPALSATNAGEFIRFDDQPGVYEIATGGGLLTTAYRGPRLDAVRFQIRPPDTRRLILRDEAGILASATVDVYYWILPEPLYQDEQLILLPHTAALQIKCRAEYALRYDSNGSSKAAKIMTEFDGAWDDALAADPCFLRPSTARNKNGNRIYFGRNR